MQMNYILYIYIIKIFSLMHILHNNLLFLFMYLLITFLILFLEIVHCYSTNILMQLCQTNLFNFYIMNKYI